MDMKISDKQDFLNKSLPTLGDIFDMLATAPMVKLSDLPQGQTVLVIIDMVNGFAREGVLRSPKVEDLIPGICRLAKTCGELNIKKIALADCHQDISPEFEAYPVHCLAGTKEAEIVDEIQKIGDYDLIPKNSTNGFLEAGFQTWLLANQSINTFIITGDCTDICVQQFAVTLKTWFNMQNQRVRVIVPVNAVDTYDYDLHNSDLVNVMALYNMVINGIEVVLAMEY